MKERLYYLDGIKGIACLMVAAHHFCALFGYVFWGTDILADKTELFYNGTWCVRLFFMISAFLLASSVYRTCSVKSVRNTVIKRYLRLALPVFGVTLLIWIMSQFGLFYNMELTHICQDPDYTGGYDVKRPFLQVFTTSFGTTIFAGNSDFNNKFWMITPLFWGNMLALGLSVLTNLSRKKSHVVSGVLFTLGTALVLFFIPKYFSFVLGTVLAYWYVNAPASRKGSVWICVYTVILLTGLGLSEFHLIPKGMMVNLGITKLGGFSFMEDHNFYYAIGIFLILFAVIRLKWAQKILAIKPLRFLGDCSYYVFLVHWPIMCSLSAWLYLTFENRLSGALLARLIFLLTILFIIMVSWLFTRTYEKGCNRITKRIVDKLP